MTSSGGSDVATFQVTIKSLEDIKKCIGRKVVGEENTDSNSVDLSSVYLVCVHVCVSVRIWTQSAALATCLQDA